MLRRDFLKTTAAAGALALAPGCARLTGQAGTPARKPNIVIILADDLGYGDIHSHYPTNKISTPHLDRLTREGMRFTDAHSGAAVCSPSRYGLLTGHHFSRCDWNRISQQLGSSMIDSGRLTLGAFLQQQGYHTGCFGKWHLGMIFEHLPADKGGGHDWSRPFKDGPNDRGFNEFFGIQMVTSFGIHAYLKNGFVTEIPTEKMGNWPKAPGYRYEDVMPRTTQEVLNYIDWNARTRPGEPFFIYHAPNAIHVPITPSAAFVGKSGVGLYGDFVMELDDAVGQVVAKLEEHGLRDDTLILFTSDNGGHGQTGEVPGDPMGKVTELYGHQPNGDLPGLKGYSAEGGHRVPFIASWPGRIAAGATCGELVMLEDILATCAAAIGAELPAGTAEDSLNILPYLDGTHSGPPIRDYAVINAFHGQSLIRQGDWVLAFHLGTGGQFDTDPEPVPGGPQGQLYDLAADPQEQHNLWLERQDKVRELTALYNADRAHGRNLRVER